MAVSGVAGCLFISLVVLVSSVAVNALQACAYLLVFVPSRVRLSLRQRLANAWWNLFLFVFRGWGGLSYTYYGDRAGEGENAILIANHERGLDFVNGVAFTALVPGLGCGRMMSMMKDSLKWVPSVGWTNYLQGSLYLKRDWERDRGAMYQKLVDMESGEFPRPFFIGIYPEGTRINAKKLAQSQDFARKNNLPVLERVLIPRTKGFVFLKEHLPTSVDCVYDVTLAYEGGPAYLGDALRLGRFRSRGVHMHVRRIPFADLPADPEALSRWLVEAFVAKDRLLAHFAEHGSFPGAKVAYAAGNRKYTGLYLGWSALVGALSLALLPWWASMALAAGFAACTAQALQGPAAEARSGRRR